MKCTIDDQEFLVELVESSSSEHLLTLLMEGPITIPMRDYAGMEKVGTLGADLPRNDEQITAEPGDLILYQGNALVLYYAPNTWRFRKLGSLEGVSRDELVEILGPGDVSIVLSLE
jgi:hypothetical protein